MSTLKFTTPGPWHISGYCRDYCRYDGCPYVWVSSGSFYQGTGFTEADARLVTAAPELYEALEVCLKSLDPRLVGFRSIRAQAKAALAKARGESV